ncbi:histidine kinase [Microbacterium sp.]|uniref:sensor histidine kinase n=1 Tax=Microbacterium sp. TaxID=51671 RepID=UPI00260CEFDD|nr:histidine kinase [Microbacterium sp.]
MGARQRFAQAIDLNAIPRERFFGSTPMPRASNIALITIVALALMTIGVLRLTDRSGWTSASLIDVGLLLVITVFTRSPPLAAGLLLLGGIIALRVDAGGTYALALAVVVGLVVYTCSVWLSSVYAFAGIGWAITWHLVDESSSQQGMISTIIIGIASALIGMGLRASRAHHRNLVADNARLAEESAAVLRAERERIIDELHNIIAHDITIVLMHSHALELSPDNAHRARSTRAIIDSATQAMTDIRRMMHFVHGDLSVGGDENASTVRDVTGDVIHPDNLVEALSSLRSRLEAFGTDVQVTHPDATPAVSHTVLTTLIHVANEATTNVLKHAVGCSTVRIAITTADDTVTLSVWNSSDGADDSRVTSGGYGLRRVADRVSGLGGTLRTGPRDDGWELVATLPRL